MLAFLYLILVFFFGDSICKRFLPFVSTPHRVATGFLAGLLISTWLTYLFAALFGGTNYPMLAGNLIFAVVAIASIFLLSKVKPKAEPKTSIPEESTSFKQADWIVTGIFLLVALIMMYGTFSMKDGNMRIANHQSSDFGSTASIMQSFALGHNFPTEYPHFTGDRIRYHFLFYFQAGNLEYLGLSPASSNNVLSVLTLLSMLVLVMTLGAVLFASRTVGRIGAILFYFHGSLAFITFYMTSGSMSAAWEKLGKLKDFLSSGLPYRGEDWGVWSQVVYLNQRHLASSIGICLIVRVYLAIRHRERSEVLAPAPVETQTLDSEESPFDAPEPDDSEIYRTEPAVAVAVAEKEAEAESWPRRLAPFAFLGLILGLMPMWNGAVFAGAAGVLAVMFFILPLRREMIAVAVGSALISLPQVLFLKTGLAPAGYSLWYFGYTITEPTYYKVFYYLAFTFGFKWIFIAIALVFATRLQRLMMVSFTALILIATCFQFSEEVLANHKFFNVWLVLMNVPVAFGIVKLWNLIPGPGAIAPRLLAVVMIFMICIGGLIDLLPIKNSFWVEYKFEGDPLVEWVRANTDPRSIFLSHRYVNHGILVAGRRLFYGHPYYAWGAGYPTSERDGVYRRMFESKDISEVFQLLKANRINYVAVDNTVRNGDFIKNNNEKIFQAYFAEIFTDTENKYDSLKIYAVPETLGTPNPAVQLDAVPTPSPTTVYNAFASGEGNSSGQFSRPRGIATDSKDNFYVADTGNARIQKFTPDGTFIAALGKPGNAEGELREPNGIVIDDADNLYVTDSLNHKLVKMDQTGNVLKEWKGPDPGFFGPRDIAIGPDKKLYLVDQGRTRIVRFDPANESFTTWGTSGSADGQFNESTGIAVGGSMIFVADAGNNRIQVLDLNGNFIRQWDVPAWDRYVWHYPDIAYDETEKLLYVSNGWKKEILAFDVDGNVQTPPNSAAEPALDNPSSIMIGDHAKKRFLLVVNTGGHRISRIPLGATPVTQSSPAVKK